MDYSSKESRAKWSAVESFSNFTWAGSAVVGGLIADAHGYHATFLVTTLLHYVATAVIIPAAIAGRKLEAIVVRMNREERERAAAQKLEEKARKEREARRSGGETNERQSLLEYSTRSSIAEAYTIQKPDETVET